MKRKCLLAVMLLIGAASSASAQTYWNYYGYGPKARGHYGTPYGAEPLLALSHLENCKAASLR